MNFKKYGEKNLSDRFDIEQQINRGIIVFNDTNNENVPLVNEYKYGIKNVNYNFEESCIKLDWEVDEGRCGDEYLIEYTKNIDYEYFESNQDEKAIQDKIESDKVRRNNLKIKISAIESEIKYFQDELSEHNKALRDLNSIITKYKGNVYYEKHLLAKIDKETTKTKGALYIKQEELNNLKEEEL